MDNVDSESSIFSNHYLALARNTSITKKRFDTKKDIKRPQQATPLTDSSFALLKLSQVLAHMQVSRSTWLEGVRTGRYPPPVQLSPRRVAWRVADLKTFIDSL